MFRSIKEEFINKREEKIAICNAHIDITKESIKGLLNYRSTQGKYFSLKEAKDYRDNIDNKMKWIYESLPVSKRVRGYNTLSQEIELYKEETRLFLDRIRESNDRSIEGMIPYAQDIVGKINGHPLDDHQIRAVIKNDRNHLVIAGAGTGKSKTILGKIKYLLDRGIYTKEEILVLSFTNATAAELKKDIMNNFNIEMDVSTFHSLGKSIIVEVQGIQPIINDKLMKQQVEKSLRAHVQDKKYSKKLLKLLADGLPSSEEGDFDSKETYEEYIRVNPLKTLSGIPVRSHGEKEIANFLTLNNIKYEYERVYQTDTRDSKFTQYEPDFYLPEYDVYIEYFGIDRDGSVASYVIGKDGKSGSEHYLEQMEWKRDLHAEHQTEMIEVYSYDKFEGKLLKRLEEKLRKYNVEFKEMTILDFFDTKTEGEHSFIGDISEKFSKIIEVIRTCNYSFSEVEEMIKYSKDYTYNSLLFELLRPLIEEYESYMAENETIDFALMINKATQYVKENKYLHPYKMIIIDEYQDLSVGNYKLLAALRKSKDFNLFAVGDDWQSIYRFTGSNINYIIDFEKYWGIAAISKIITTYRFSNKLTEISGNFIMKNPRQVKKKLEGKVDQEDFPLIHIESVNQDYLNKYILKIIMQLPKDKEVFLIGRVDKDLTEFEKSNNIKAKKSRTSPESDKEDLIIQIEDREDLTIKYMNAHGSKGLQADYVFIINNRNDYTGFPSQIPVNPFVELLLGSDVDYKYSEERRLFYVALTRAKEYVYFGTIKNKRSEFANELLKDYKEQLTPKKKEYQNKAAPKSYGTCPQCGGDLYKRKGKNNEFLGCSNYSKKKCKYTKAI